MSFILFTKLTGSGYQTIRIKASGYTVINDGKQVTFNDGGKQIAVFNTAELVGFIQEDHIVN